MTEKQLTEQEEHFLREYEQQQIHRFRDILIYASLLEKIQKE